MMRMSMTERERGEPNQKAARHGGIIASRAGGAFLWRFCRGFSYPPAARFGGRCESPVAAGAALFEGGWRPRGSRTGVWLVASRGGWGYADAQYNLGVLFETG